MGEALPYEAQLRGGERKEQAGLWDGFSVVSK